MKKSKSATRRRSSPMPSIEQSMSETLPTLSSKNLDKVAEYINRKYKKTSSPVKPQRASETAFGSFMFDQIKENHPNLTDEEIQDWIYSF